MKSFNHKTIKLFSNLISTFLTITRGSAKISQTSEIPTQSIREILLRQKAAEGQVRQTKKP